MSCGSTNIEVAAQRECVGLSGNCPVLSIVDKCCVTVAKAQLKSIPARQLFPLMCSVQSTYARACNNKWVIQYVTVCLMDRFGCVGVVAASRSGGKLGDVQLC